MLKALQAVGRLIVLLRVAEATSKRKKSSVLKAFQPARRLIVLLRVAFLVSDDCVTDNLDLPLFDNLHYEPDEKKTGRSNGTQYSTSI